MSNTIQSKTLATTPLDSTDILAIVQGGVLKRTTVSVIAATNEESGTWTPAYATTGTAFSAVTYGDRVGRYRKIGSLVYIEARLKTNSITKGGASGNIFVSGLPFPVLSGTFSVPAVSIGVAFNFLDDHPIGGVATRGTSNITLYKRATVGGSTLNLVVSDMDTSTGDNDVSFSAWYVTT